MSDSPWELSDQPECATCDGNCCKEFCMTVNVPESDLSGEALLDAADRKLSERCPDWHFIREFAWESHGLEFAGSSVWGWVTCAALKDGKCSRYDTRPLTCRQFPYGGSINAEMLYRCPLAQRLIRERGQGE